MKIINQKKLMELVRERPGTQIATIISKTEHALKKSWKGPKIFKVSQVNGMLGYDYENSVNLQREREGKEANFEAESRRWGIRLDRYFVEHKGKYYLTIKVQGTSSPTYYDQDGNEVDRKSFQDHEYARSSSSRQEVEKQVIHREYSLDNIMVINMMNEKYLLQNKIDQ